MLFHVITYVMSFYKTSDVMLYDTSYGCFITYAMLLYNMLCLLYNMCHVMLYNICYEMLYNTCYVMFVI